MVTKLICTLESPEEPWELLMLVSHPEVWVHWSQFWNFWNVYRIPGYSNGQTSLEKAPTPLRSGSYLSGNCLPHSKPHCGFDHPVPCPGVLPLFDKLLHPLIFSSSVPLIFSALTAFAFALATYATGNLAVYPVVNPDMCWGRVDTSLHDLPEHSDWQRGIAL